MMSIKRSTFCTIPVRFEDRTFRVEHPGKRHDCLYTADDSAHSVMQPRGSRAERVRVFCRVRPLLQREREGWSYDEFTQQHGYGVEGSSSCPQEALPSVFLTEKDKIHVDLSVLTLHSDGTTLTYNNEINIGDRKEFTFDASLREDTPQDVVYQRAVSDIVKDVLDGYNGTVLAYGQTSTGKTYTMLGKDNALCGDQRGIIPRAFEDIFDHAQKTRGTAKITVALSYVQIYCERIFDLLSPDTPHSSLMIREDSERGGVYLDGAACVAVTSVEECIQLIERGNASRAVASTGMNAHSSRSHAVLIARIERKELSSPSGLSSTPGTHVVKMSSLYLVDLAGSERVKKAKVYGRHVNELKAINLSLSSLGNCISALSKQQPQRHVPCRDSKLTRLLSSSLGGNAKTSLIITVSPSPTEGPETISTLQFGQRAMKVVVQAHQNVMSVLDYKSLYEETQQKLDESRATNQQLQADLARHVSTARGFEDQLVKAHLRIQHLEFECQAAKLHSKSFMPGQQEATTDGVTALFEQQVTALVKQHEQDIAAVKQKCDLQVDTYKRLAEEAQQEWHELEDLLTTEKQQVLTSLMELKDFKIRFYELEDTTTDRIAELLADECEKEKERKYEKELLLQQLASSEKTIKDLEEKIAVMARREQELQDEMQGDYVPKEAIKQMEALYESAISKLQARVGSLEQRSTKARTHSAGSSNNQEGEPTTRTALPAVAVPQPLPPGRKAVPKVGRIVPASRANSMR